MKTLLSIALLLGAVMCYSQDTGVPADTFIVRRAEVLGQEGQSIVYAADLHGVVSGQAMPATKGIFTVLRGSGADVGGNPSVGTSPPAIGEAGSATLSVVFRSFTSPAGNLPSGQVREIPIMVNANGFIDFPGTEKAKRERLDLGMRDALNYWVGLILCRLKKTEQRNVFELTPATNKFYPILTTYSPGSCSISTLEGAAILKPPGLATFEQSGEIAMFPSGMMKSATFSQFNSAAEQKPGLVVKIEPVNEQK